MNTVTSIPVPAPGGNLKPSPVVSIAADWTQWDAYVERHEHATFCHSSAWKRAIERTWGHRPAYLIATRQDAITGLLPLFYVKTLFGTVLVSTPNAVYGGVAADDSESADALLNHAKQLADEARVKYLELRNWHINQVGSTDRGLQTKDLYVSFDHSLTPDETALIGSFPRETRRMIRQGAKHQLTAHAGREELLDEFYDVYAFSLRALGTPVFPKRLFTELLRAFPDTSDILAIRREGRLAGAVLSFYFRDSVAPYYAGAYREFFHTGVNYFMYWELMRHALRRGCARFDFGRSKKGTGAYAFKTNWGMNEWPLPYSYYLVTADSLPAIDPTNPRFRYLIDTWKRLPLGLTRWLGPLLARSLP